MSRSVRFLFLSVAAFLCFLASYLFLQTLPFYKSIAGEEDLFYGKISSVAFPRGWHGTGIPLFDRTFFYLNEDRDAVFTLSLPSEQEAILGVWISFWSETGMPAPIEVRGIRISPREWIVTGLAGNDGELDASAIRSFQLRAMMWSGVADIVLLGAAFLALRRALRRRR